MTTPSEIEYPSVDDILAIHEDIIAEDAGSEAGVRSPDAIQSALRYISEGYFGQSPRTIHSKAAHLMRLLVAEHPFVDGNKRTALNTVVVFYELNDFEFEYEDESIRAILKDFATDADSVEMSTVIAYLREHSSPAEG